MSCKLEIGAGDAHGVYRLKIAGELPLACLKFGTWERARELVSPLPAVFTGFTHAPR
jgi:hypothetical protein